MIGLLLQFPESGSSMCRLRYYFAQVCGHYLNKVTEVHEKDCERTSCNVAQQKEDVVHPSREYCDDCLKAMNSTGPFSIT
jgi:hypothetical protein